MCSTWETSQAAATFDAHPPIPSAPLREPLYPKRWKDPVLAFGERASGPYCVDVKVTGQGLRSRKFWIKVAVWYFQSFTFPEPIEMGLGKSRKNPAKGQDFLETVPLV